MSYSRRSPHRPDTYSRDQLPYDDHDPYSEYPRDDFHYQHHPYRSRSRSPHGNEPSPAYGTAGYRDRDAPLYGRNRTPEGGDRDSSARFVSRDVIVEGFGAEVSDDDIMKELVDGLGLTGVEKVTLIKDRKTGISRGFVFVHFSTTMDSMGFVDKFGPQLKLCGNWCKVAFSKERDENERQRRRQQENGEEWTCRVCMLVNYPRRHECFRCQTPRTEITATGTLTHPTPTHFTNDGERDAVISPPSQFLIFRHLETTVSEEILFKGVLKLCAPTATVGASENSIRRVLLVRDRRTNESWRFGFAEFTTPQEAQKALTVYEKSNSAGGKKFTISSKPVMVSYIHPGVFVPVFNAPTETDKFTFLPLHLPGGGGGMKLAYWDEEGYVSEFLAPSAACETKAAETALADKKTKKRKGDPSTTDAILPKKTAVSTPAPAAHLQFWQNRHSELHGSKKEASSAQDVSSEASQSESFADMNKLACLLCSRMFKTAEKLHEHERVSDLHSGNLKKPELIETARKKLAKAGSNGASMGGAAYRDRAAERRQVFGAEKKSTSTSGGKAKSAPKEKEEDAPVAPVSKGAALLGKMGWLAGQGLGATGEGRTEHVVADVYTQGAGLGMKGAKVGDVEEAAKSGGSYDEFVKRTRERAKERFEGMN